MQTLQQNQYLQTVVQTATPAQLLLMLFDGAIRHCRISIDAIKKQNTAAAHNSLIKCQDIIREFIVTLDHRAPIAEQLLPLYEYFLERLIEANLKKTPEPVAEVLEYLTELRQTWAEAAKQAAQAGHGMSAKAIG